MSVERIERRAEDADALRQVLASARAAFARFGVHRTRMEDVATGANMPRQYLYRFVSGREELVQLALLERCREMTNDLRAQADALDGDLRPDIVTALITCLLMGRRDAEFTNLAEALPRARLGEILTSAESPVHDMTKDWLRPVLDRARAENQLRSDVDEDAIVDWLRGVLAFLSPRDDLDEDALRTMMTRFMLPSILVGE